MSRKRGNSLDDDDVKLFFTLGNALLDASIAAWYWKFKWDYVRPITGIRELYRGRQVLSWLGPYKGYGLVDGERWIPYQELRVVTPPFPEYVSGHSTFSAAGAKVITTFLGSDSFGASVTVPAGTSRIEPRTPEHPGTPAKDVTLYWPTFSAAANEAGMSRRYGGIHYPAATCTAATSATPSAPTPGPRPRATSGRSAPGRSRADQAAAPAASRATSTGTNRNRSRVPGRAWAARGRSAPATTATTG